MTSKVHFSSEKDDWETPDRLFEQLDEIFGFVLDAAATINNAKVPKFCTDGLEQSWEDGTWCNPPYGHGVTNKWMEKGAREGRKGKLIVMLVPARMATNYWFKHIWQTPLDVLCLNDYDRHDCRVYLIKGRLTFKGAENSAPFPSALIVWNGSHSEHEALRKIVI